MFSFRCLLFALGLLGLNLPSAQGQGNETVPRTKLTEARVVELASRFCKRIGQPVNAAAKAIFPVPQTDHMTRIHWQERWKVIFSNQAELEIADATGVVVKYMNSAYFKPFPDHTPAGSAISRQKALQIATDTLKATGHKEELKLGNLTLEQTDYPPTATEHSWDLVMKRTHNGVPYRDEYATVSMNAETGEIIGLALVFPSPPAVDANVVVSQDHALAMARQVLTRAGRQDAVMDSAETKMVQPNSFWQPGGDVRPVSSEARNAWVCGFRQEDNVHEVWIDAETGVVLGGETIGRKGRGHQPSTVSLKALLQTAEKVEIYGRRAPRTGVFNILIVTLSEHAHPRMLKLLRAANRFTQDSLRSRATYSFVIYRANHAAQTLYYNGQLGTVDDWVRLPDEFTDWLKKLSTNSKGTEAK